MKKIFTLIAVAMMAIGANAQTYNLGELQTSAFTFDATAFAAATVVDNEVTYPCFNYIKQDKANWSELKLTDSPITFLYKNSGKKDGFFRLYTNYFNANGKGARIQIATAAGKYITIKAAGKNDSGAIFAIVEGAEAVSVPAEAIDKQTAPAEFTSIVVKATAATVVIEESNAGFNMSSITISDEAPTGISAVTATKDNANDPIYNLAGQQVSKNYKGVVIQNGVKRIQK